MKTSCAGGAGATWKGKVPMIMLARAVGPVPADPQPSHFDTLERVVQQLATSREEKKLSCAARLVGLGWLGPGGALAWNATTCTLAQLLISPERAPAFGRQANDLLSLKRPPSFKSCTSLCFLPFTSQAGSAATSCLFLNSFRAWCYTRLIFDDYTPLHSLSRPSMLASQVCLFALVSVLAVAG